MTCEPGHWILLVVYLGEEGFLCRCEDLAAQVDYCLIECSGDSFWDMVVLWALYLSELFYVSVLELVITDLG